MLPLVHAGRRNGANAGRAWSASYRLGKRIALLLKSPKSVGAPTTLLVARLLPRLSPLSPQWCLVLGRHRCRLLYWLLVFGDDNLRDMRVSYAHIAARGTGEGRSNV